MKVTIIALARLVIVLGLLSSCQSTPENTFVGEQCSPQLAPAELDPLDNKWYIPVETSVCRCRQYRIDSAGVGPVRNSDGNVTVIRKPIEYCNLLKGYLPKDDTRLVNMIDWWRVQIDLWNEPDKEVQFESGVSARR